MIDAGWEPTIGAGFPTDTYWLAPIKTTGTYTKIEPAPIGLHEQKKKKEPARIKPELTIVVIAPSPNPHKSQIETYSETKSSTDHRNI